MMLTPEPLMAAAFAPFGKVIEADPATAIEINSGFTTRFNALAQTEVGEGDTILSIFRGRPRPLEIDMLERHPLGSQAFMPLGRQKWLSVVAETPDPTACRAFICEGHQGVQYNAGTWHFPLLVLGAEQDFLIVDRAGAGDNLDEEFFDMPIMVAV